MVGTESESAEPAKRVFISYARVDRDRLAPLGEVLTARGYSVWWDANIPGGATFAREIETALRGAHAVIVAWSKTSVDSDWVRDEAAVGRDMGRLTPISLDGTAAPLGFGQYQVIDFSRWSGDPRAAEISRLVHAIDRTIGKETPAETLASTAARVRRRPLLPRRRSILIGGALAVPFVAGGAWWASKALAPAATAPPHSIAVLPFANLGGDASQDYFSDGLSEELRAALVRIDALQVAARASSNAFKNAHQSIATIAHRLGVAYILDGSVRREGQVVRVSAQLTDAASGFEKWSQTYDRPMSDVFAIQTEIANLVAAALEVKVLGASATKTSIGQTSNPLAFDHYLKGRHLYDQAGDEATFRRALAEFDAALAADPAYADAHAARARALIAIGNQFAQGAALKALYDEGLKAAQRAVALAPNLAAAQSTLGFARFTGDLDVRGAAEPYERARALAPGDAGVLSAYGAYAANIGRIDLALTALDRAAVLDPLNPRVARTLANALYGARRYPEAIARARAALSLNPAMTFARSIMGNCLVLSGKLADALAEFRLEPLKVEQLTGLAIAERALGDTVAAEAAAASLAALGENTLYQRAEVEARFGRTNAALVMLEQAYAARDSGLVYLAVDPMLDPLRHEPRFTRLLARIGFV